MITIKKQGLYQLNCGAIARECKSDRFGREPGKGRWTLEIMETCGDSHHNGACDVGMKFVFTDDGLWMGREREPLFNSHVKREIEP